MDVRYRLRESLAKLGIRALKASGLYNGYWQHWRGRLFDYAEGKGLHILPVHYYSPVPEVGVAAKRARIGLLLDEKKNAAVLNDLLKKYDRELRALFGKGDRTPTDYDPANEGFGPLDAATLYAFVRERRPKRIIEIGSGNSTLVTAAALRANADVDPGQAAHFTCIEPYLPPYLREGVAGVSEVIEKPLQDVSLELFTSLQAGDILFIDSTHVVSFGSDVVYEYLTILPALASGVLVHIHDIFLPSDYPEPWLKKHRFFWNEQYLLEAFLSMNPSYRVELGVNAASKLIDPVTSIAAHPSDTYPVSYWISRI
jgi:hypothetical protein